ncbi:major facilitator superfamily domain-containing protein [Cokeromyces recurvatus]|uniref:major facilitator superfamily domain-containing protein n=1 Tax=Cokeromyces recurvatus TaxID=90255 RepID=UPI00221E38B7|nr:major facilitator superfamily domain-containing protein [Cokeromyces recurvatus]KAI7901826.1 major facilitator superfamily domain-containing protein [Cokeromyces recurvatus]
MISQRSSININELNGLTLTSSQPIDLEKISTVKTEKYDVEVGGLGTTIMPQKTNVTIASIVEMPKDSFYDTIPDGGYGWVIAFIGFLINFVMFGTASIWGVFSHAWATTILKDRATTVQLMGVGTTLVVCLNIFTPISPLLARLGARITMMLGSILMSLGIILAGFSTQIWHLYLTQGVLFGIGASLVYMSIVAVIPQWFTTRRGTAMGISSAGSGFGGLALSPMVSSLVEKYGLPWTHRIIGLMAFGICAVASMLIRTRLPPDHKKQPIRSPIKLSMLKDFNFVLLLCGLVISLTGYLVPLFYLPKYCATYGINATNSSAIVGVACAMNAIGRLILGYIADRVGRLNMYVISSILSGLFCMLIWPFAKTYGSLMAFAVLFGFTCGIYYALASPITATVVGIDNISSGLSIMFVASAIAGTGPPIASAIQQATPNAGYIGVQMFAGAVYIFGSLLCVALKVKMTGSLFSVM